jgi:hypothetical protein
MILRMETKKQEIEDCCPTMIDVDSFFACVETQKKVENNGSRLGLRLASVLKECGLVHHSICVEMH